METVSFKELKIGDKGSITKTISEEDVKKIVETTGDVNPTHIDEEYAKGTILKGKIVHGMISIGLISAVYGTKMPGPGSVWMDQNLKFLKPVRVGDTITATSELVAKIEEKQQVICRATCVNQKGELVVEGESLHKILEP